jgi:hypothetical protein
MAPAHPQPGTENGSPALCRSADHTGQQMSVSVQSTVDVNRTAPGSSGIRRCRGVANGLIRPRSKSAAGPGLGVRALGDRLQGATTLQGETLFQQPGRRIHRTGLACTSLHRFRARAIFYPNFYPKVQQSGAANVIRPGHSSKLERLARMCYQPSKLVMRVRFPSPAPARRLFSIRCSRMSAVQVFYRAAGLPMRCFSSSIAILELIYVDVRGWWDYPSFYPKCQQP